MISKNGAVLMDISIREFDKINELINEHKEITEALNRNITNLLRYQIEPHISIGDIGVNLPKEVKNYGEYSFGISFKKADEINEIIKENRRLGMLLYSNIDKLRYYNWSVEIMEVEEKQPPLE